MFANVIYLFLFDFAETPRFCPFSTSETNRATSKNEVYLYSQTLCFPFFIFVSFFFVCPTDRPTFTRERAIGNEKLYHRLRLPVNAYAKTMFSRDVKRLCFRRQTLKFSRSNLSLRDLKRLCFRKSSMLFRLSISVIFAGFPQISRLR